MTPEDLRRLSPLPDGRRGARGGARPDMLEFLVDGRFVNGTATMIIDLARCTVRRLRQGLRVDATAIRVSFVMVRCTDST
jgi:hypothetical protein